MVSVNRVAKTAKAAAKDAVRHLAAALVVVPAAVAPAAAVKRAAVAALAAVNRVTVVPAVTHHATPPVASHNGKNRQLKAAATASRSSSTKSLNVIGCQPLSSSTNCLAGHAANAQPC
jgi:hypothetical protein